MLGSGGCGLSFALFMYCIGGTHSVTGYTVLVKKQVICQLYGT